MTTEPRWSPLFCLPPAQLTPSGLLELDVKDGEVELIRREGVEIRSEGEAPLAPKPEGIAAATTYTDRNTSLTLVVTTHRIVFHKKKGQIVRFLHLSNVHAFESTGGGSMLSFASPKIQISTYAFATTLLLCFKSTSTALKDREDVKNVLQKALDRRAWETASRLAEKQDLQRKVTSRRVGVDAILSQNKRRHEQAAQLTDTAFEGDAETLLREATELVRIIQKYSSTLEKNSNKDQEDTLKLSDMMSDMGMTSALTKQDHQQSEYNQLLARHLSDFLRGKLKKAGGVMTLTDVYCLYNRARGTNLISPEDLLQAVSLLSKLGLGMSERVFPSGVRVVQEDAFDDDAMAQRLADAAEKAGNVTALQISKDLHIPSLLAQEQLLAAERKGYLCRDVTLESTRFFPNRFQEFALSLAQ